MLAEPKLTAPEVPGQAERLPEFEGLRAILSWWVFASHALLGAGLGIAELPGGIRILAHGDYAVDAFIILSGFVISKLLIERAPSYRVFLGQRFFRLYPAYLVALFLAILLQPVSFGNAAHLETINPALVAQTRLNLANDAHYFPFHLLAHLTMLHGIVPDSLLPGSGVALLPPAWSISLEWQFYLVAPLLVRWLAKSSGGRWLVVGLALALGTLLLHDFLEGYYKMPTFLPQKAIYFWFGMVSFALWRQAGIARGEIGNVIVCGAVPLVIFASLSLTLGLWGAVLGSAMVSAGGGPAKWIGHGLRSAPLQHLGRISYSTYLANACCICPVQWLINHAAPQLTPVGILSWLVPSSALLTYLFSRVVHRFVELPGIALGKRLF
ncbi:MAG: acyltransferase [Chthoniobacter sp.]|nr:acyltransferase [Chthoniobacter sp.]